jgi:hypothetical protein
MMVNDQWTTGKPIDRPTLVDAREVGIDVER